MTRQHCSQFHSNRELTAISTETNVNLCIRLIQSLFEVNTMKERFYSVFANNQRYQRSSFRRFYGHFCVACHKTRVISLFIGCVYYCNDIHQLFDHKNQTSNYYCGNWLGVNKLEGDSLTSTKINLSDFIYGYCLSFIRCTYVLLSY